MSRDRKIIYSVKKNIFPPGQRLNISPGKGYMLSWIQHTWGLRNQERLKKCSTCTWKSAELTDERFLGPFGCSVLSTDSWKLLRCSYLSECNDINWLTSKMIPARDSGFHYTEVQKHWEIWVVLESFIKIQSITNKEDISKMTLSGSLAATHMSLTRCQSCLLRSKRTWSLGQKWARGKGSEPLS